MTPNIVLYRDCTVISSLNGFMPLQSRHKTEQLFLIIILIQCFEADFLWKVSLKILNSGLILKTFTHEHIQNTNIHI